MTATWNDQNQLKSILAKQGPSTHDTTRFANNWEAACGTAEIQNSNSAPYSHSADVERQSISSLSQMLEVTHGVGLVPPHCEP